MKLKLLFLVTLVMFSLGALSLEVVAAATAYGAAAGAVVGTAMAFNDQCLSIPTVSNIHYESC